MKLTISYLQEGTTLLMTSRYLLIQTQTQAYNIQTQNPTISNEFQSSTSTYDFNGHLVHYVHQTGAHIHTHKYKAHTGRALTSGLTSRPPGSGILCSSFPVSLLCVLTQPFWVLGIFTGNMRSFLYTLTHFLSVQWKPHYNLIQTLLLPRPMDCNSACQSYICIV